MAEPALLTSAHGHARKATKHLQDTRWTEAAESHQQASHDFSQAARGTSDGEALRVLRLLEDEHRKLASIILSHDPSEDAKAQEESKPVEAEPASKDDSGSSAPSKPVETQKRSPSTAVKSGTRLGNAGRESSPSLAREIATRRGIPPQRGVQISPSARGQESPSSPEARRPRHDRPAPRIPPSVVDSQASLALPHRRRSDDDEGFSKFYSSLTNGTMSRLSSVLAYAGLPLTGEAPEAEQDIARGTSKQTTSAGNEPDMKKYFSKAALDAIEDEHRQKGTPGYGFGPAESFYVVQTGGGTHSYADIARAHQQQQQQQQHPPHLPDIGEDDEEAFLDARDAAPSASLKFHRGSQVPRNSFGKTRTNEELELENTTIKNTLEQLNARLQIFETHAQDASMAALTQSMASLRPPPPPPPAPAAPQEPSGPAVALQERLQALEKKLEAHAEEKLKLEGVASKQEKMLKRYQSKWEEVKKSAKEKERAKREKAEKEEEGAGGENVAGDGS